MLSNYNFNLNPYYDDFDESNNFYRILFKPGFAVQARELTQLQTQLQDQIAKFGSHIFKDGSVVLNGNFFFYDVSYILASRDNSIDNFENQTFRGVTSGAIGKVIKTEAVTDETVKIYYSQLNGSTFQKNESIICDNTNAETIIDDDSFIGSATAFSIDAGVFFVNGHFVYCNPQTIILSENEPATCRVGLVATEFVVTSNQDTSLLDPALGSYNYSAPGADRYSISLDLVSFAYDPQTDDAEENSAENFIELSRFVSGTQTTVNRLPLYSDIEDTLARRTFDESGDYTVRSFALKVKEHVYGNTELFSLQIEPGKAYVKGYEFETISPTYLDLPKSRFTVVEDQFPIFVNYGSYITVQNVKGNLDFTGSPTINLYDNVDLTGDSIGTARVNYFEYDSEVSGNNIYRLYLDEVVIFDTANVSISDIRSVNLSSFQANTTSSFTEIQGNENSSYILKIPKDYVKTLLVDGGDTSYTTLKKLQNAEFISNGVVSIASVENIVDGQAFLGGGVLSESDTRELFFLTVVSSANTDLLPIGTVLDYTTNQLRIDVTSSSSLQIQTNSPVGFSASVFGKIAVSNAIQKTKSLQTATLTIQNDDLTVANLSSVISLGKADCLELSSVIAISDTSEEYDYTSSYTINSGQTDELYDHGFVQLNPGSIDPITASGANITSVVFTFSYYAHSSTTGFFSVDSYPDYDSIPKYSSSTGEVFDLTNCIDFRPRRQDDSTEISGTLLAEPSTVLFCDLEHYIGRIDRLVLTKERKFSLIQGIPSLFPAVPVDVVDAMSLYIIDVPPYTKTTDEVTFSFIENKRYTMRDIGRLEKRIERMEFYTSLSLLEKQAADESIPSDVPTIDRFKNGILVDSFAGHSVGDVSNTDYRCSIDFNKRYLRPSFATNSYNFKFASGTNHLKSGDLITLSYTTETFVNQPLASRTVNLNPYFVFNWNGYAYLNPSSDTWVDTHVKPDVVVNLNGENDVYTSLANNVNNPASVGVRWTDWQTINKGVPQVTNQLSTSSAVNTQKSGDKTLQTTTTTTINNQTTTVTEQLARVGVEIKTGAVQTVTKDLGTKIVDVSIAPFIRSRIIDYSAKQLRPSTDLIATFDDVEINNYCFPATEIVLESGNTVIQNAESIQLSTNSSVTGRIILAKKDRIFVRENGGTFATGNTIRWVVNGTLVSSTARIARVERPLNIRTNEKGDCAGSFLIPSNQFRTGEKLFKLSDTLGLSTTTAAATKYVAQGLSQSVERNLVSTRVASVSINPTLDTKSVSKSSFTSSVISTSSNTVDVTPPPPPAPPPPPLVSCGRTERQGRQGTFEYTLEFGSNTGSCGITFDAFGSIPDRFTIVWDGNEYTTGFVGGTGYNARLRSLGFPEVVGPRTGQLLFNKTKSNPTKAILKVDAPFSGTAWAYKIICPGEAVTPPAPVTTASIELTVTPASAYSFFANDTGTTSIIVPLNVNTKGTSAIYARVTNLTATRSDTGASLPITRFVFGPGSGTTNIDIELKNNKGSAWAVVTIAKPTNVNTPYNVAISGLVTLFTDSARTIPAGLTDTGDGAIRVSLSTKNRPKDPVAQTFFVDANQYPNGLFLDSIDLYFKTRSLTLPVTVELRPTVNGYPSSSEIVPFSVVNKEPEDVLLSNDASVPTNFKFEAPIYLPPGEHCFVARCDTTEYEIYTAFLGDTLLSDPDSRITEQPAVGSMFKSQNLSTWTPVQEEDVMFKLNKCVFSTNPASVNLNVDYTELGNVVFDVLFADGENLDFAATNIDYYYKTTDLSGTTDSTFKSYQLGSNITMPSRRKIRTNTNTDLQFNMQLSTQDVHVSPVLDLSRFSTVLIENVINNAGLSNTNFIITNPGEGYTANANVVITSETGSGAAARAVFDSNTGKLDIVVTNEGSGYTGNVSAIIERDGTATANATVVVQNEIGTNGGNAVARYITRKVTLAPNFESLDLKVYLLANVPSGSSIKVYYKVAPITSVFFDAEPWREMIIESAGVATETGFADYKYKTVGDNALPSNDRFKTFAIKIVMLSAEPTRVPIVRDLRVVALDD
jgi:hypothetical protein